MQKLLAEIDRRPQQILIEATILRATLNEDNALGVDFNVMGGVDLAGVVNGGSQITNSGRQTIRRADQQPRHAGMQPDGSVVAAAARTCRHRQRLHSPINGGLKLGYVTNNIWRLRLRPRSGDRHHGAGQPQSARAEQAAGRSDRRPAKTATTPPLTPKPRPAKRSNSSNTGTRLIFRPYIGDDGYIRMEIHPEDSSGSVTQPSLPIKITTEVTSNMMVKDGHTIVIGGLFRESSTQRPRAGAVAWATCRWPAPLFRQQHDTTAREEVIILLTPHIVKDDAAYSRAQRKQMKNAEKLRVGVRKGMMPWGRERLAEACVRSGRQRR